MKSCRSVNQILDQLASHDGQATQLEGVLEVHEEGYAIKHYPNAERRSEHVEEGHAYRSGVWLEFGNGSIRPNEKVLERWHGKRVRVYGIIRTISSLPAIGMVGKGGFGPWGFWPASIEPASVQRVTAPERREDGA